MRVIYIVPYSPFVSHDHAASEMLPQLVARLAKQTDLHVYTPGPLSQAERARAADLGCTVIEAPPSRKPGLVSRLGKRPYWQHHGWPSAQRIAARDAIARLQPDVVHGEYLQVGETVCDYPFSVLGYHDVTTDVTLKLFAASHGPTRAYRYAEYVRTRQLESRVTRKVSFPVAISTPVLAYLTRLNPQSTLIRPGVDLPSRAWSPPQTNAFRLLFTGAMWREANSAAARVLIEEVMPVIWLSNPDVVLRIAGADPRPELLALRTDRIEIVGRVASLDDEMLAASACVATTVVGGGLLFKAVRPMALGCPVIMNRSTAAAIGATSEHAVLADTPTELANAALDLLGDKTAARAMGGHARQLIADEYRWDRAVESYLSLYKKVVRA